jgi:hypothetical protein
MTERNFGEAVQSWIGVVANVMDPHRSGRVQVRILGRHDDATNIPDEDLPWAQLVQPVTSAAFAAIGTAPVGMVVGSRVYGHWLDRDHQYPLIMGVVGRAGTEREGQTEGGSPSIDLQYGSAPPAADNNPVNPYSSLADNRTTIAEIDQSGSFDPDQFNKNEGAVVTQAVEEGMSYADLPTTASADPGEGDILSILRSIDPSSTLSSLQCLPGNAANVSLTIDLTSPAIGFVNMMSSAVRSAILRLMNDLGVNNVLNALNSAATGIANFTDAFNALSTGGICGAPRALNSIATGTQAFTRAYVDIDRAAKKFGNAPNAIRNAVGQTETTIRANAASSAFRPAVVLETAPDGYIQQYYAAERDPYPGYIRWNDGTGTRDPVYTLRNGQPNFRSAREHTSFDLGNFMYTALADDIRKGNLTSGLLERTLLNSTGLGYSLGFSRVLGKGVSPANMLAAGVTLLPQLYSIVNSVFTNGISVSVLADPQAISDAVNRSFSSQSVLARKRAAFENAFRTI